MFHRNSTWIQLAFCAILGLCATAAGADDRDLLRQSSGDPYVFIVFDTSGSMHWAPPCSQESYDLGDCDFLCPTGDCYAPLNGDDPASKFYQAKEALHEVLQSVPNVNFGFATYNQDELRVRSKHWYYRVSATTDDPATANEGIALDSGKKYPLAGAPEVFGRGWNCDNGADSSIDARGCRAEYPADLDDPWELQRVQLLPKHCTLQDCTRSVYIRDDADTEVYRVTYWQDFRDTWPYGLAKYRSKVKVERCDNNSCSNHTLKQEKYVYYDLVDEFVAWDAGADQDPRTMGFFSQTEAADPNASNTCDGWDGNADTGSDKYPDSSGYNLRWPTDTTDTRDDPSGDQFDVGDVLPLDWNTDHKADILGRLAPAGTFDVAPYFHDYPRGSCSNDSTTCYWDTDCSGGATCGNREGFLRLKDETQRPLLAFGSTPLGNTIKDFRTWYNGCASGSCNNATGWEDLGATADPDWACRKRYLLVITDGDNTCGGPAACSGTAGLRAQTGVKTFVVAFGVQGSGNQLTCMAANGGTGEPIQPKNKQELVTALNDIFSEIRVEARSFASASVPTVQNETSDRIYLSNFTPLPNVAVWPGRIDAFRKPLPLKDDDTPDFARDCATNGLQAACHLWDAGDVLKSQAPTPGEADLGHLKLGLSTGERRVLYGTEPNPNDPELDVPTPLRFLRHPAAGGSTYVGDAYDLWRGLGLIPSATKDGALTAAAEAAAQTEAEKIIGNTLKIKTEIITDPDGDDQVYEYVLGDVFHADPEILTSPNHLGHFRQDLHGYREFAEQHFWRRKMLLIAANDGQLHAFDAGIRKLIYDPTLGRNVPRFTDGTGRELFSYIPRLAMPVVGDQYDGSAVADSGVAGAHIYSLDGLLTMADVYIDPLHSGTPNRATERGWRSVVVGGLREGGDILGGGTVPDFVSGYYALDLTQPDKLLTPPPTLQDPDPLPHPVPVGSLVPSCLLVDGDDNQGTSAECPTPAGSEHPFPAELWTFTDRVAHPDGDNRLLLAVDEDDAAFPLDPTLNQLPTPSGNGVPDLCDSWSKPVIAQIQVCTGATCRPDVEPNDVESRFVAIFGGGLDSQNPSAGGRGNWLYMVDMETGRAIYKRQLLGSAAAGIAALDRDQDGILDVVYAATTAGYIYKVDLTARTPVGGVPTLADVDLDNSSLVGNPLSGGQKITVQRIIDPIWDPFPIFDTGGRQIYMTPTALYVPRLDQFALAVGTGNRHQLWERNGREGRFYNIVDEDFERLDVRPLPRTEADYETILYDAPEQSDDLLLHPPSGKSRGWVLQLDVDDRVITQAFALVSVVVFSTFRPFDADPFDADGNPIEPCARTGKSRVFVVDATNANAFADLDEMSVEKERYLTIGDFTTAPYVDQTATKNPLAAGQGKDAESVLDPRQQALQEAIREALKRFFPEGCRYNNAFALTVNASRSDTGFVRYATIPIAMCPSDWKGR